MKQKERIDAAIEAKRCFGTLANSIFHCVLKEYQIYEITSPSDDNLTFCNSKGEKSVFYTGRDVLTQWVPESFMFDREKYRKEMLKCLSKLG